MSRITEARINLVAAGTIGEPGVFKAIVGDPDVEIEQIILSGFGLRRQFLDDIRQDSVREDLRAGWNVNRGIPFLYATTLVYSPGEKTPVSLMRLNPEQWKLAQARLEVWNYHLEGWFRLTNVKFSNDPESYYYETLAQEDKLYHLPRGYQGDPYYQRFIRVMEEEINKATFLPK